MSAEGTAERILIVEDDPLRCEWFSRKFSGLHLDVTCNVAEAIAWLKQHDYNMILLDHDLLEEHYFSNEPDDEHTGYAVALWLSQNPDCQRDATILIHSLNYIGAARMLEALHNAGRDAEHVPFSYLQHGLSR
jgi:CheY-like chemotaxis protein